jgi:hypothetical protein
MSGWRRKKQMSDDRFGISYSWTQPYHGWPKPFNPELAVIEAIDRLVESGLTHPQADLILKKLKLKL